MAKGKGKGGKKGKDGDNTGDQGDGPGGQGQGSGKRPSDPDDPTALRAENLKGKIDPKGRITVTTFRGLPKPGEVTVELREALQRARDDAQAPLDSEEIPRRYRDGIREYFDELGKSK